MVSYLNRYLDPAESLAEILFGLIMVLTCTLGASLLAGIERESLRATLIAALGCNIAWGVIDAALYVMGNIFGGAATTTSCRRSVPRPTRPPRSPSSGRLSSRGPAPMGGRRIVSSFIAACTGSWPTERRCRVRSRSTTCAAPSPSSCWCRCGDSLGHPVLLIGDPLLALRVANVVQVALLFVVGFHWARSIGGQAWLTGLVMMLSGVVLVGVAIALGG